MDTTIEDVILSLQYQDSYECYLTGDQIIILEDEGYTVETTDMDNFIKFCVISN